MPTPIEDETKAADDAATDQTNQDSTGSDAGTGSAEKTTEEETKPGDGSAGSNPPDVGDLSGDDGGAAATVEEGADPKTTVTLGEPSSSTEAASAPESGTEPLPVPSQNTSDAQPAAAPVGDPPVTPAPGTPIPTDQQERQIDTARDGRDSFIKWLHQIGGTAHKVEQGILEQATKELQEAENAMRSAISWVELHIFNQSPKQPEPTDDTK